METKKRRVWNTDSFAAEVYRRSEGRYILKGEYISYNDRIDTLCNACGNFFVLSPHRFIVRNNGCPYCTGNAGRDSKWLADKTFEVVGDEFTFLDEYKGSSKKHRIRHNPCGVVFEVSPSAFFNRPVHAKCPEDFRERVRSLVGDEYIFQADYVGNHIKIPVLHNTCGKVYNEVPSAFLAGQRCTHCNHSSRFLLSKEYLEVRGFTLEGDYEGSKSRYRISHTECGNYFDRSYTAVIKYPDGRLPICDVCEPYYFSTSESYATEVAALSNEEYEVVGEYFNSGTPSEIRHRSCGHVYKVAPNDFRRGRRCPNCIYSRGEKAVADVLDSLSIEYTREHSFEYLGRKRFDFFIPSLNIAIEYDGEQHYEPVNAWGGEEYLESVRQSDALKNDFCDFMGIDLLRIPYWEFDNINEIVTNFIDTVKLMRSISANGSEMAKCR